MSLFQSLGKIKWRWWAALCLALVTIPMFAVLVWQLIGLDPERYCQLAKSDGVPPGDHCFKLLMEGLKIKGWTIWMLIGGLVAFVLMLLSAIVKTVVAITGPNGMGINIGHSNINAEPRSDSDVE